MATLKCLKKALRQKAENTLSGKKQQQLSDTQYRNGFDVLVQGSGWTTYQDFIVPQLAEQLTPLFGTRSRIAVLEVGPGPRSVLENLPYRLRQKIWRYDAFEPNTSFSTQLEDSFVQAGADIFPGLETTPYINRTPFLSEGRREERNGDVNEKYDVVLFCHSMYGMKPKRRFVERALDLLVNHPDGGLVAVCHRDGLYLDGLVCHQTASFPGVVHISDDDKALDDFAEFIAGYVLQDKDITDGKREEWRGVCRALGEHEGTRPGYLLFGAPDVVMSFSKHATSLPELTSHLSTNDERTIKNGEARQHRAAAIVKPKTIQDIQYCVRWALDHKFDLTVLSGGHGGYCVRSNVVSVDITAFDQVHILKEENGGSLDFPVIVAGTGCTTGDIIRKSMRMGLTVPLGSRPSVGAGLWLQGGIGHLARLYGLASDAIVGAVLISVESSQVLYVGHVPDEYRPTEAIRAKNEAELLWAIKGAGTNFGIVVSVTFKAFTAPSFSVRKWIIPLRDDRTALTELKEFSQVAKRLDRKFSMDAYLYQEAGQLRLGVTVFGSILTLSEVFPSSVSIPWGTEDEFEIVDCVGLFETEMYVSNMHGGHGAGKTSSFKRCLFLSYIGTSVMEQLVRAAQNAPSVLCYFHLIQGGGAIDDTAPESTAFGCRGWKFACIITGVWPRHEESKAQAAIQWVHDVAGVLLSTSSGAYSADLGPDPRDTALASAAFGSNGSRLARLKGHLDPHNVLAYTCPLIKAPIKPKVIILVTGESGAGKDYCAAVWCSILCLSAPTRVISISDVVKREYTAVAGGDLSLFDNRAYKEEHRAALTNFFKRRLIQQPRLLEENFLDVVAADEDVLLVTGMRDEAPVASLSHLVPESKLIEVQVQASEATRWTRRGCCNGKHQYIETTYSKDYRSCLLFNNDTAGSEAAEIFARRYLLPLCNEDLKRLAKMVRTIPGFPRPGIKLRHVLGIPQQPGGLALCSSLLQSQFTGDWPSVNAVVSCEVGGLVFASALASQVGIPLFLIREAGKLPPPTISAVKRSSHISSLTPSSSKEKRIEMERDAIRQGASVVVVDDVLASGETLCATLQILYEAGAEASVMVLLEFPAHRGRELLRLRGFGKVQVQSLLVFGGL